MPKHFAFVLKLKCRTFLSKVLKWIEHLIKRKPKALYTEKTSCAIVSSLNHTNFKNVSALGVAVLNSENMNQIEDLLLQGCDVNYDGAYFIRQEYREVLVHIVTDVTRQIEGVTVLNLAAEKATSEVVQRLLEVPGIDVNAASTLPASPLYTAVKRGDLEIIKLLVEAGADLTLRGDVHENTMLMTAAYSNSSEIIKYFIEKGLEVNLKNKLGWTALHIAASNLTDFMGNLENVKTLVLAGADIDVGSNDGSTPLMYAVLSNDNTDVVEYLLEQGADVNAVNSYGSTALFIAASKGKLEMARTLVMAGVDIHAVDHKHQNALMMASIFGKNDVVQYLLERGADINSEDVDGLSPLHFAAGNNGNLETTKTLLKHGANIEGTTNTGATPIMSAILSSKTEIIQYLIDEGAEVNVDGEAYPLAFAIAKNNLEIIKMLVMAGADVNLPYSSDEYFPLLLASNLEHPKAIQYLLENGADVNAKDINNGSASLLAVAVSSLMFNFIFGFYKSTFRMEI